MSTRVGTLQRARAGRSIWPAAILASLVMLTIAFAAVSLSRDHASQTTQQNPQTVVGGTAANTPSELSGGIVGGTAAKTFGTTAGSSSMAVAATADVQAAIIAARNAADADSSELSDGTTANTPSELTGGLFERYGRHQRI